MNTKLTTAERSILFFILDEIEKTPEENLLAVSALENEPILKNCSEEFKRHVTTLRNAGNSIEDVVKACIAIRTEIF